MADSDLIKTGISGLDQIFLGGVLQGNVILVEGAPGTGKSMLGTTFIYRGITEFDEPGMIVVFETSPHKLIRDYAALGWNLEELQEQKKLKIIFTSPQVLDQELRSPDSLLLETAADMGARRIFIDGLSLLRTLPHSNGNGNGASSYREILQQLCEALQRENLTAMLSHEVMAREEHATTLEVAEFLVDTVIVLKREANGSRIHRTLEISKSRGQDYDSGKHTLRISNKGPEVFRRVQAPPRGLEAQPTSSTKRSAIGAEPLDTLLGGGIFDGSVTLVVGISGAGKTVLSVQVLLEGAKKEKKRGMLVSLDEHPAQIMRNASTLGLDLQAQVDAGMISVFFESPQELDLDSHYHDIVKAIEEHKIQRLIIDGMTSYSTAIKDQQLYRDFFHGLMGYCKHHLITTFLNYENPELFGLSHFMPEFAISSIVDNIIVMNFVELSDRLHRAITVAKARGSNHSFVTREFQIGQGGISLLPIDQSLALPILPFQSYYGLLSRAPTRVSPRIPYETAAVQEEL